MSKRKRVVGEDERKLWTQATRDVVARQSHRNHAPIDTPAARERPKVPKIDIGNPVQTAIGNGLNGLGSFPELHSRAKDAFRARDALSPSARDMDERPATGLSRRQRRKVKVDRRIDLHGLTRERARQRLLNFLRDARRERAGTVLVITGVGRDRQGVLKTALPLWLAEPDFRTLVASWSQANRSDGGDGAFYLVLSRRGIA
ncbi:MAG: Smr/MutS family protein [Geminicoccaceae bacterium]